MTQSICVDGMAEDVITALSRCTPAVGSKFLRSYFPTPLR